MRIKTEEIEFVKEMIVSILPEASVFMFGSRSSNDLKGGDIDLLVLAERPLNNQEKRNIRIAFYKEFGEQRIDITSFRREDTSVFKDLALLEAIKI